MTIGEKIQFNRKKLNLSQEELAKKLFVSRQTISLWEKNETSPTIDNLLRLKEIFGVSIDMILDESSIPLDNNTFSLDTICGALSYTMGIEPPKQSAPANKRLCKFVDKIFGGEKADRIVMYNPDAVAQWIYKKYPEIVKGVKHNTDVEIPLATVMPSVTPVCFATMYTGAQPAVHGIQKYEKPVLKIDTIFDALARAGKKVAIVTAYACSISRIFAGRNVDYYHYEEGNWATVNATAMELILKDEYDFIVVYNGNYDAEMHKFGPESREALGELRMNDHAYSIICELIKKHWKNHNTLVGFAMDHGCHEVDGGAGSHGLDMPEDINITHCYKAFVKRV